MRVVEYSEIEQLLSAEALARGGPGADEADRPDPYEQALSGFQAHCGRAGRARPHGRPETGATIDAANGYTGNPSGS